MRQKFTEAPAPIRERIEHARQAGLYSFVLACFESGYDCEAPATPHADRLRDLRGNPKDGALAGRFELDHSDRLGDEARAAHLWQARRQWAATTELADDTRAERERIAAARRQREEAQIDARAAEIVAADDAKKFAKARDAARKELGQ